MALAVFVFFTGALALVVVFEKPYGQRLVSATDRGRTP